MNVIDIMAFTEPGDELEHRVTVRLIERVGRQTVYAEHGIAPNAQAAEDLLGVLIRDAKTRVQSYGAQVGAVTTQRHRDEMLRPKALAD